MQKDNFFLHEQDLSQNNFTRKSASITTNLICDKTAWKAQKTQIVQKKPRGDMEIPKFAKKMPPKKAKMQHNSLLQQNSVKFC